MLKSKSSIETINNIYKKQDLIFSKLPTDISEIELKLINTLYKKVQTLVLNKKQAPTGDMWVEIELQYLKETMKINNNNYNITIKDTITKLSNRSIILNQFVHPETGIRYNWYLVRLIKESNIVENHKHIINIQFSEFFLITCWRKIQYTKIDIDITNSFKSKYSIRLYEVLKTFEKYRKNVDINLEMLNTIFLKDNNKYISKIVDIINRNNVYNEINSVLPFTYEVHKQDKIITFNFNNQGKK